MKTKTLAGPGLSLSVPSDSYKSAQEFLKKMDAGDFDGSLPHELKKLSKEQLEELARVLLEREAARRRD